MVRLYSKVKVIISMTFPLLISVLCFFISKQFDSDLYCIAVEYLSNKLHLVGFSGSSNMSCILDGALLCSVLFFIPQIIIFTPVINNPISIQRLSYLSSNKNVLSAIVVSLTLISFVITPIEAYSDKYFFFISSTYSNPYLFSLFVISPFYFVAMFWALIITTIYFNKDM